MAKKLGIVADDFTGANDTAAQFAARGVRTTVLLSLDNAARLVGENDVVSYSTETRESDASEARERVRAVAEALRSLGVELFYKKVDSTLRGNIGVEIDSLMDLSQASLCVLAPAYPAQGRVTIGGYHLVDGVPLARSYYGDDPTRPVGESSIARLLETQTSRRLGHLTLSIVMGGVDAVAEGVIAEAAKGCELLIADAVTEVDLRNVAEGVVAAGPDALLAGSAGLAAELPEVLGLASPKPVLVVCGSPNPVCARQVHEARRATGLKLIELDGRVALLDAECRQNSITALAAKVKELGSSKRSVVISSTMGQNVSETQRLGRERGLSSGEVAVRVARTLAETAARATEARDFAALVMLGGATSFEVSKALGAGGIAVEGEVAEGIPVGRLIGGRLAGLRVVTKAGGFGGPSAVVTAMKELQRR